MNTKIFKAYDIRGIYPNELNEEMAYKIGQGYLEFVKPDGKIAVGMDVRISSPKLKESLIRGITEAGVDVVDLGLISTEMLYFAVGNYGYAGGIQVTASHNPAEYNGFKMVREAAYPLYGEAGINQIRDFVLANQKIESEKKGVVETKEILDDFAEHMLKYIENKSVKPMRIVINPNFGYEGEVIKYVVKKGNLPIELIGINDIPDGTFPKGRPDPFIPENRPELIEKVLSEKADFGVAWDADADRVFFCTGSGIFLEPYYTNTLFVRSLLAKYPGSTIVCEPRYTWALTDTARECGGKSVMERVGHSYIKARMKKENAIFCGESSGHTYFRDFWFADTGVLPFLLLVEMISKTGQSLDQLVADILEKYPVSGEINSTVDDPATIFGKIKEKYLDAEISELDGISIEYKDWRANVRSSNTEPLVRLNVEAKNRALLENKKEELLKLIRE